MTDDSSAQQGGYWGNQPPPPTRATREVAGTPGANAAPGYWGTAPQEQTGSGQGLIHTTGAQPAGSPYAPAAPISNPAWSGAPASWVPQARASMRPTAPTAPPGRAGGALAISIGGFLVLLSIVTLDWAGDGLASKDFSFFHTFSDEPGPGLTQVYFGWLAYVLLVACVVAAYLLKFTGLGGTPGRWAVAAACVISSGLSFGSLWASNSLHDVIKYADAGFWCAVVGYLVIAAGVLARA